MAAGRFRADLYWRLNVVEAVLPALAGRTDIAAITDHVMAQVAPGLELSAAMRDWIARQPWPGNVRELRNVVERAVYRWEDPERAVADVEFDPFASPWIAAAPVPAATHRKEAAPATSATGFRASVAAHERALLAACMEANRYNQRAAAASLGLTYDQLRHALRRHKLLERAT